MSRIKDMTAYIISSVCLGLFSLIITVNLGNNNIIFNSFILLESNQILKIFLTFTVFGVIQYYTNNLYTKINWKIAGIVNYLIFVISILLISYSLGYINNIINIITCFLITSTWFIIIFYLNYKKYTNNNVKY